MIPFLIRSGFKIVAFEHGDFRGNQMVVGVDHGQKQAQLNLQSDWNDKISSIIIERLPPHPPFAKGQGNPIRYKETPWKNCTQYHETTPGRRHEWCRNDFGPTAEHVGQTQGGCSKGQGKGVCKYRE